MHLPANGAQSSAFATKFIPPRFSPADHVERRVVATALSDRGVPARHILVDAQAGQGKSTFAAQLLHGVRVPACWYQLGPEDHDPVFFLEALVACLSEGVPGFSSPLLAKMLAAGEVSGQEPDRHAALLLEDLKRCLREPAVLVFDDVYRVEGAAATTLLLRNLLDRAPARLRLVLLSRLPILPALGSTLPPERFLRLGNAELSFTHTEVAELFNTVLGIAISPQDVKALRAATEGWAMGLKLAAHQVAVEPEQGVAGFLTGGRRATPAYFASEVLGAFGPDLRTTLLKCSLLDEIPASLANAIADIPNADDALGSLARRNFFVRAVDSAGTTFVFHHLFRECLLGKAQEELGAEERNGALRRAAQWHHAAGNVEEAVRCHLRAGDYREADGLLAKLGTELRGKNRISTLRALLEGLTDEVLAGHPWLSYYHAVAWFDTDPPAALRHLLRAREGFGEAGDEIGELLALGELVWFRLGVDAKYNEAQLLLDPADQLYLRRAEDLDLPARTNIATNLALGFVVAMGDLARADRYSTEALRWAMECNLENLLAGVRAARGYQFLFAGNPAACRREIEASLPLLENPRVTTMYGAGLRLLLVNGLSYEGDFANYARHKNMLVKATGEDLVARGVFGAWIKQFDIREAFDKGRFEEAEDLLERVLRSEHAGANPHFRSLHLQYASYVWAAAGKTEEALRAAEESLRLRDEVGSEYTRAENDLMVGGALARLDRFADGLALLDRSIARFEKIGNVCNRSAAHGHRALARLHLGRPDEALADVRDALAILKRGGHTHAWGWCPEVLLPVLSAAVKNGIEPAHARKIAAERLDRALRPDGSAIPLLRVRALGPVALDAGGVPILSANELTPIQRQLLALLAASPGMQRSQEEVQTALWPEGEPEKARASFDVLLSRLRRTLDGALGAASSRDYLVLKKGILSLENSATDAAQFRSLAKQGLHHATSGEAWQAANALWRAEALWQGDFAAGVVLDERGEETRRELRTLYLKGAEKLGVLLLQQGDAGGALGVIQRALSRDPLNSSLVRTLYGLHSSQKNGVKAQSTVKNYAADLAREGYSTQEVQALLDDFWSQS